MLVDTHCHLNLMVKQQSGQQPMDNLALTKPQLDAIAPFVHEAQQNNVGSVLTVGTTLIESLNSIAIAQQYPGVWAIIGIHPSDCTPDWQGTFYEIKKLVGNAEKNKIVGIGETGLDYYWPNYYKKCQRDAFKAHTELSLEYNLALSIHMRPTKPQLVNGVIAPAPDSAQDELFELLQPYKGQITRGVMHCFCHDRAFAQESFALGFCLGIGGVITYPKNSELRSLVQELPLEKMVLETDAPFLPPQIARGTQNHPKYIATIAQFLADLKGTSLSDVAEKTTRTAQKIFGEKITEKQLS